MTSKPVAQLTLLLEKAATTYAESFVAFWLLADQLGATTAQAAAVAAIPAALTIVANGLPGTPVGLPFWADLAWRTIRTYVAAFLGLLLANPMLHLNFTLTVAAAVGALPAALAVVKGTIASNLGAPTPALVPAAVDANAVT